MDYDMIFEDVYLGTEFVVLFSILTDSAFTDFFTLFPYSPPCIFGFLLCLIAAFLLLFMPETLNK